MDAPPNLFPRFGVVCHQELVAAGSGCVRPFCHVLALAARATAPEFFWETISSSFSALLGSTVGYVSHLFYVKEARVNLDIFSMSPLLLVVTSPVFLRQSMEEFLEEFRTFSASSLHLYKQVCLQLRVARSLPCDCRWFRHREWYGLLDGGSSLGTESGTDFWKV